ncbi:AfsA-related hotdog domain-containing protein [Krasilnikovia sp. MM14-A1259]|uniref:AfsA-related hotdog domain-containing protein n=1 Tax=Krasilnikovia sp. MM14-A1259 TaxID=3373539 RepID=UPI00382F383C
MQIEKSSGVTRPAVPPPRTPRTDGSSRHLIVVADRFASFADGAQVYTVSELLTALRAGAATEPGWQCVVHTGQGVDRADRDALGSAGAIVQADSVLPDEAAVPPGVVHKNRPENVLLSALTNSSSAHCTAALRIHRDNEFVLDHQTARHVPGMVVIEAMRQICIAQFETAYRPELAQVEYLGIWRRMNLSFEGFLFALPATVDSEIVEADLRKETNLRFRAVTSVWQYGDLVASAEIDYSMVRQDRIGLLESRRAARAAASQLHGQPKGEV